VVEFSHLESGWIFIKYIIGQNILD
jgi:hypothetical protein